MKIIKKCIKTLRFYLRVWSTKINLVDLKDNFGFLIQFILKLEFETSLPFNVSPDIIVYFIL